MKTISTKPSSKIVIPRQSSTESSRIWARHVGRIAASNIVRSYSSLNRPAKGPIEVVDLFCGCGGMSSGFEYVGRLTESFRLAGAVDFDKHAVETYSRNLPLRPLLQDLAVATSSTTEMKKLISRFDLARTGPLVVIGGPPCQGFSAHRKKAGEIKDSRNPLVIAFTNIVSELRPDLVVFENVPEVLSKKHWRYFTYMKDALEREGYVVRAQIHNLAEFGVPQARFRAVVIASRRPFEMPSAFLLPRQYSTVRQTIGNLTPVSPGERHDDPMHFCTRHRSTTIAVIKRVPKDGGRRPHGVGPPCLDKVDGFRDVYGRMYWDRPANTITASARNPACGRYVHPEQDRGLTIREAALLQGFPQSFMFEGPFDHKYLQIGNAVSPIFAAYLAGHVLGELTASDDEAHKSPQGDSEILRPTCNSFSSGISGRKKSASS